MNPLLSILMPTFIAILVTREQAQKGQVSSPSSPNSKGKGWGLTMRILSKRVSRSTVPGSSFLTLATTRKSCQIPFLTQAKGLRPLPFYGTFHHCQYNLTKSGGSFGDVSTLLQTFSRVICSFPQTPLSPRATDTSSCFICCPRLLPAGTFPLRALGTRLGGGRSLCTLAGEGGGKSRLGWASGITETRSRCGAHSVGSFS